jgi:hypothetical protein
MRADRPLSDHRIPLLGAPVEPAPSASEISSEERAIGSFGLGSAFDLASAELGFVSASWLFLDQVAKLSGREGVLALRDELGSSFSVLDFVASEWLEGKRGRTIKTEAILQALEGTRRVLVVGLEAAHLDVLARELHPTVRIGLVTYRLQRVDWARVIDNYAGRVEAVDLASFQGWAGARSAVLTFVYGVREPVINVLSAFLRVIGSDVRTQFRDIIGWNVLARPPDVYPRYLVEALSSELTELVDETG